MEGTTLNVGTMFIIKLEQDKFFGVIKDYTQDEDDNFWFVCDFKLNVDQLTLAEFTKTLALADFEHGSGLVVFKEEEGQEYLTRRVNYIKEREDAIREESEGEKMVKEETQVEPEPEIRYLEEVVIESNTTKKPKAVRTINYTAGLKTGDVNTLITVFEESPKDVWQSIEKLIGESQHLLLTFLKIKTCRRVIEYKIEYEKGRDFLALEKMGTYKLEYNSQKMEATHLGNGFWLTGEDVNSFYKSRRKPLFTIDPDILADVKVTKSNPSSKFKSQVDSLLIRVDPNIIQDQKATEIFCKTDKARKSIELDKNWQQVMVYYYFTGGELDPSLNLKHFDSSVGLHPIATIREDASVLERLEAV